jgi:ribosomal protein S18 acetylase RimI-like enzyme
MTKVIKLAQKEDLPYLLETLREEGVRHSYAIQDLTTWFEASKFYFTDDNGVISYVLLTGHPAAARTTTLVAEGVPADVTAILKDMDIKAPFLLRETPASLLPSIRELFPEAKVYLEQRMEITEKTFIPQHRGMARPLSAADAQALAQFHGAPPQAAGNFLGWRLGAKAFFGVFENDKLVSIGSSMVASPEAWNIVAIKTLEDYRGRGFATEVVSALVAAALQETETVTLTVVKDNAAAIRTYEKVGFAYAEDRIWVDNGANAAP